jgi:4'-phosphopantetheinyl transferase
MLMLHTYQLVSNETFQGFYKKLKPVLPSAVVYKTERFKFWEDRQRSLIGEIMVRKFYKDRLGTEALEFELNEHEKPSLKDHPNEHFNISHSGDYVVVAFSDENVGVDVEMIQKDRRAVAERFFTDKEIQQMHACATETAQIHYFYQLWTLKESYMKAIGKGMTMSLSSFSFLLKNNQAKLEYSKNDADWHFYTQLWNDKAFLSICAKKKEPLTVVAKTIKQLTD